MCVFDARIRSSPGDPLGTLYLPLFVRPFARFCFLALLDRNANYDATGRMDGVDIHLANFPKRFIAGSFSSLSGPGHPDLPLDAVAPLPGRQKAIEKVNMAIA